MEYKGDVVWTRIKQKDQAIRISLLLQIKSWASNLSSDTNAAGI